MAQSWEFDAGDFDVHLFDWMISFIGTESPRYCLAQREDAQAFDDLILMLVQMDDLCRLYWVLWIDHIMMMISDIFPVDDAKLSKF